jgi:hypothetical protein
MSSGGNDRDADGGTNEGDDRTQGDANPVSEVATSSSAEADGDRKGDATGAEDSPEKAAQNFVNAVAWGEHLRVWELFSTEARETVLRVAKNRGMDETLAARLRDDRASGSERDLFLADLINGLRADLRGNDLDAVHYEPHPEPTDDPKRARVRAMAPVVNPLLGAPLPVASIDLVWERDRWRVVQLIPQASL